MSKRQILRCIAVGGIDAQRIAELLGCFVIRSHLEENSAEIVIRIGIIGIEAHGLS